MSFRSSLVCLFLLAAILILAESPNSFWVAPALSQESSVSNNGLVRQEVSMTNNQWLGLKQGLLAVFPKQVFGHPAKPEGILFQVSDDTLVMDYDPIRKVLRIEGRRSVASALARIANTFAMESTVAKDRSFRVFHLTSDGQEALAEFAEPEQLASRNPREPRQQKSSGIRLASGFQDPSGETVVIGGQPETQDERKGSPEKLPLPQFEGVQIEMLPELDAVILRGRDQQLTDLSEIIKRLDEASRESKPRIEVVNLQHVASESMAKVISDVQEKFIGTRQGRVTVAPLVSPNALLLIGWGEALDLMKQLVSQLDQPTRNDSTLAVIQLKHATATEVQTQLQSFYKGKEGLAPVISSFADSRSNAVIVNGSPRDIAEIRKLLEQIDVPRSGMLQAARVFQIRHSLAADIAKSLEQALTTSTTDKNKTLQIVDERGEPIATGGVLGSTKITVNDRNNTLIVSSAPETLPLIEQFIQQLDTPGAVAKIKIFPIKNGDAATLVETLRSLLPSSNTATGGAGTGPELSSSPTEGSLLPLRFTVDTRGNNIIAVGSEADLKIVEALTRRLDSGDSSERKSMVYQLKNSPAVDVALAINQFLQSKRTVEQATPGANNPFDQLEREVVVVPEPVQNKLILSATPRFYDEISQLIQRLDEQPPQVMIQVMIAEITLGNTDEFGIEMGLQDSVLFDRSLLGNVITRNSSTALSTPAGVVTTNTQEVLAASNTPGFNFNNEPLGNSGSATALQRSQYVGGQGLSNFAVGRTNPQLGFGGLVLSASSENVSFLLRALQDSRRLEVLSRPQVLTLDNQQAFIQVGQRIPRIVNSIINQNGTQNVVALENVGLIIGVTPRISPEGNVVMEIDAEKSKLGPEAEGIPISISQNGTVIRSPRVDTITAQATVSAADGETIILGGLISKSSRTNHRSVPWLGDIPIIKYLFSYDLSDITRTELLIIMTPHIVRSPGDMERLKQAEFARMSWCEADVFDIHGDVFPRTQLFPDWQDDEDLTVVYPDQNPRGEVLRGDGPPEGVIDRNSMMDRRSSGRISPAPRVYYETQDGDSLVPEGAELPPPVVVPQRSPVLEKPKAGLLRMPRTLPAQPASSKSEPERRAIGSGAKTAGGSR